MTDEQKTDADLPCIFDAKGALLELTDEQAMRLSETQYALYARVAESHDHVLVLEKKIHDATETLKSRTAELRAAEDAVRTLPRPSRIDLVRQMARQTAGR